MQNTPLPTVNWKSIGPDPNNTPGYGDTDEYGNEWFMSANQERIILKTRDGRHFEAWTTRECWDQYLAAGFEINVQTLLVDALYFAWSQAEAQGLTSRADQFRSVYESARDGNIGQTEELQQQLEGARAYAGLYWRMLDSIREEVARLDSPPEE